MKGQWIKDYLSFTKKERVGVAVLLAVILLVFLLPNLFPDVPSTRLVDKNLLEKERAQLQALAVDSTRQNKFASQQKVEDDNADFFQPLKVKNDFTAPAEFFLFDPNTITTEEWKRLGLRDKTITTIQNYLNKGGRFYKPDDLYKIYGLRKELAEQLIPYVVINKTEKPTVESKPIVENKITKEKVAIQPIEINTADSLAFVSLPGIGPILSQRIIRFREKLGGFVTIQQVSETFGLPDSTFQKIKPYLQCRLTEIKKLNINVANFDQLKAHPYIHPNLAAVIVRYRMEHGPFSSVESIQQIALVTAAVFDKLSPYLSVD
jgi:DNA uptake protein ComE-like DNA-binding protein